MAGLGLVGTAIAGGMAGAGEAGVKAGIQLQKQFGDEDLQKMKAASDLELATSIQNLRQAGEEKLVGLRATADQSTHQANATFDSSPDQVNAKIKATNQTLAGTLAARTADAEAIGRTETKIELDRFMALDPVKRKAALDAKTAEVTAMSTPDMLKRGRAIAQSTHIVDPNWTLIPNSDGTVTTFDTHSGATRGNLKGVDGKDVIRKDPEELKAATAVINMANSDYKIAQAEHKTALLDAAANNTSPDVANETFRQAGIAKDRMVAPAYAVLYAKGGIVANEIPVAAPVPVPNAAQIAALKANPNKAAEFEKAFGAGSSGPFLKSAAPVPPAPAEQATKPATTVAPPSPATGTPTGGSVALSNRISSLIAERDRLKSQIDSKTIRTPATPGQRQRLIELNSAIENLNGR